MIIHRFSAGFTLLLGQGGKRSAIPQGANHFKNNQNLPGEENVGTGPGCHLFIMSRQIVYSDTDGGGSSPETVSGIQRNEWRCRCCDRAASPPPPSHLPWTWNVTIIPLITQRPCPCHVCRGKACGGGRQKCTQDILPQPFKHPLL